MAMLVGDESFWAEPYHKAVQLPIQPIQGCVQVSSLFHCLGRLGWLATRQSPCFCYRITPRLSLNSFPSFCCVIAALTVIAKHRRPRNTAWAFPSACFNLFHYITPFSFQLLSSSVSPTTPLESTTLFTTHPTHNTSATHITTNKPINLTLNNNNNNNNHNNNTPQTCSSPTTPSLSSSRPTSPPPRVVPSLSVTTSVKALVP